jgi:hypothetical protein
MWFIESVTANVYLLTGSRRRLAEEQAIYLGVSESTSTVRINCHSKGVYNVLSTSEPKVGFVPL